jgi:ABC-2 type transport system ATP-binding protein
LIESFKSAGRTILLTTHYMDEAERLCDRLAIMDRGKIIARGSPRELIASLGLEHVVELSAGGARPLNLDPVRRLDGVRDVRTEDGTVRLQAVALHRVLPAVLDELGRQELVLTELRTRSATLEDVFVSMTGRHLRDE